MISRQATAQRIFLIGLSFIWLSPALACPFLKPSTMPLFHAASTADARALATALRPPPDSTLMVAKEALDWAAAPPKNYAILDISDRRPNERSKPQTIFVLTFNRHSRGPGMLHVLDRTRKSWRTLLSVSFDPARQEISVGDARPPGDEEFSERRLRLFSIDPIIPVQASRAKTQQQIMKLAGYEGRWSWQPLPDRQKELDAMFDNADGPLWLWTGKGFKRIPSGAAREQFEAQWRGPGMFCGTLP